MKRKIIAIELNLQSSLALMCPMTNKFEDSIKQKSPAIFDEVEVGMDSIYAALLEPKNPDKQKAIASFEQLQTTLNKLKL